MDIDKFDIKHREELSKRIFELRKAKENSGKGNCAEVPEVHSIEKDIIDDKKLVQASNDIEKKAKSINEEILLKKQFIQNIETINLSEEALSYFCQAKNGTVLFEDKGPEDKEYGVPEEGKYPLYDKHHVESAIRLFGHVNPKYEAELASAIISRMKKYNIPFDMVGKDNGLYKYLPKTTNEGIEITQTSDTLVINMVRSDLQDELSAIKNYDDHADTCEAHGYEKIAKVLRDIRDEEKVHVGELQKVLNTYDKGYEKAVDSGEKEASEKFSEKNSDEESPEEKSELSEKVEFNNDLFRRIENGTASKKEYAAYQKVAKGLPKFVDPNSEEAAHMSEYDYNRSNIREPASTSKKAKETFAEDYINESILDTIQNERCRDLFSDDETVSDDVVDFILKTYKDWESQLKVKPVIKSMYMTGSLLGFMYSSTTDLDVHVTLDCTDDELFEFKKTRPALVNIPNTAHPIEITLKNTPEAFESDESVYDLLNRKMVKLVKKEEISEVPDVYISRITKFYMDSIDIAIGNADREINDLNTIEEKLRDGRLKEEDYKKAVLEKKDNLKAALDGLSLLFDMMRSFRAATMNHHDLPFKISIEMGSMPNDPHYQVNEMIYKTFAKYGYRERLIAEQNKLRELIENIEEKYSTDISVKPDSENTELANEPAAEVNDLPEEKDESEEKEVKTDGGVTVKPNDEKPLTESVTFVDNAGNVKTMSAENYNKDMHEYNTKTSVHHKRFKLKKRTYNLRDDI